MPGVMETIEEHPYLVGGGVFVVGVIIIYYYFSGSSSSGGADNSSFYAAQAAAIGSGNQLQAAQIAGQVTVSGFQAAVNKAALDDSMAISLAHTKAHSDDTLARLSYNLGVRQLDTDDRTNVLTAASYDKATAGAVTIALDATAQQTEQQRVLSAAMVTNHAADIGLATKYEGDVYDLNRTKLANDLKLGEAALPLQERLLEAYAADQAGIIASAHADIVNSVTQSYQTVGNYSLAEYLANLDALTPGGRTRLTDIGPQSAFFSSLPPGAPTGAPLPVGNPPATASSLIIAPFDLSRFFPKAPPPAITG